ncbi:hypothetical protein MRX96_041645 [Rhipicephalus microplus]
MLRGFVAVHYKTGYVVPQYVGAEIWNPRLIGDPDGTINKSDCSRGHSLLLGERCRRPRPATSMIGRKPNVSCEYTSAMNCLKQKRSLVHMEYCQEGLVDEVQVPCKEPDTQPIEENYLVVHDTLQNVVRRLSTEERLLERCDHDILLYADSGHAEVVAKGNAMRTIK